MAEEIDLEKCNFWNFRSRLTLDRMEITHWCAYLVEVYPHTELDRNRQNFLRTHGRTDTPEFSKC